MENQKDYQNAKKRLQAKLGFKIHAVIYTVVILLLMAINYSVSSDYLWVKWPMFGWGIGLFFHALNTYVFQGNSLITEDMIRKEMEKDI